MFSQNLIFQIETIEFFSNHTEYTFIKKLERTYLFLSTKKKKNRKNI